MTKLKILGASLAIVSVAAWAQKGPATPLKSKAIWPLTAMAANKVYKCKDQESLCLVPVYVRVRSDSDPKEDSDKKPIHCIATIDFGKVRTVNAKSLYFVVINKDSGANKGYRFNNEGLWFSADKPNPAHSKFARLSNGGTTAEWQGGSDTTVDDGWAFLPWVYFKDGGVLKTCHAADPLIANDG